MTTSPFSRVEASVNPFFLKTPRGYLFSVYHAPRNGLPLRGKVLCIPPFNEEMNRCRSVQTQLAQTLAGQGFSVLMIDLHGTGDSSGEYHEARWLDWLSDIAFALEWLAKQPGASVCALLGIRLGAILAAQVYSECHIPNITLLLWQPVLEGKAHLTQFLRIRIAAQLDRIDRFKKSTADMRQQWIRGELVEVAGYAIHPLLAADIDAAVLLRTKLPVGSRVLWLEQTSQSLNELSIGKHQAFDVWKKPDVTLNFMTYADPPFWQVHERVSAPQLITKTSEWLASEVTLS